MRYFTILALAMVPLFSQSNNPAPRSVPDDILFSFFFRRLSESEAAAKATNSDSPMKRNLKVRAGLTDTEFSLVRESALSCNDAYEAKTRLGNAEVRQLAVQNSLNGRSPQAAPPAVAARIDALERERALIITDCRDSLKRSLSEARFAMLYRFVRAQGATIRYVDPATQGVKTPPPPFLSGGGAEQGVEK